ncbi:hypothetical protein [Streptomyces prasinus]|uniref:hypothetical protein n=1 Tax=Streptomyces prasinus TaxID=67345 RepID=UPI0033B590F3
MTIKLEPNHRWETAQTFGRMPDNLSDDYAAPEKTWMAAIVDNVSGRFVVKAGPHATEADAIADAARKYTRR